MTTLQEQIDQYEEHQNALLGFKDCFIKAIGLGTLPNDENSSRLLNNIDILIAQFASDRDVIRWNAGDAMSSIPPATKRVAPDLDLRSRSLREHGVSEILIEADRRLWLGQFAARRIR